MSDTPNEGRPRRSTRNPVANQQDTTPPKRPNGARQGQGKPSSNQNPRSPKQGGETKNKPVPIKRGQGIAQQRSRKPSDAGGIEPLKRPSGETRQPKRRDNPKNTSPGKSVSGNTGQREDAPKEKGRPGGMKRPGSNVTGVDYSDKKVGDQLKHQAADAAMDATPGLAQANSARKALKNHNRNKDAAGGGTNGLSNKVEDVVDDALDKGIDATTKGLKMKMAMGAASAAGKMGVVGALAFNAFAMLKSGLAAVAGFFAQAGAWLASAFSAVSSFVTGLLGVGTVVANAITGVVSALVVTTVTMVAVGLGTELTKNDDAALYCNPDRSSVAEGTQDYVIDGELAAIREANAEKLWSVYSQVGASKEQTAAVLGNLQAESGLDPTSVETIYTEPFQIGPKKQSAISVDFDVHQIDNAYGNKFPAIKQVGIGLAQWTNERNRLLITYANAKGMNWFDFDTQVMFMLDGDHDYRQEQLLSFLNAEESGNVDQEAERFMNGWIGLSSPNNSLSNRQQNAQTFMFVLERATVDTDYANGILSGVNVDRSDGNHSAGAYHWDDGCGDAVIDHYGNKAADGTGEVPSNLTLVPWSRATLPASLKEFAVDPSSAGLAWGSSEGWASGIIPDQCVALAASYFIQLYPEWDQGGRPTARPFGDGKDQAGNWASHFGEKVVNYPSEGAIFSDTTTSQWGHTGIVQHVFANGDILIAEQNIRGVSGANAPGMSYSWSWRVIKKNTYESKNWTFFKPSNMEPQWTRS